MTGLNATARAGIGLLATMLIATGLCSCTGDRQTRETIKKVSVKSPRSYRDVDPALVTYEQTEEIAFDLEEPRGIAVGADGRLYVVGDQQVIVDHRDPPGRGWAALADSPHCIDVDDVGTMYIGYRDAVRKHDASGAVLAEWRLPGEKAYVTCVTLADEDLWVADAGNRVILHYDLEGQLLGRLGEKDDERDVPGLVIPSYHLDVVVGPNGMILVNNPGRQALETYTADGQICTSWRKASMEIDGFCGCCNPTDIAVLDDGRVVTAEKGVPRVKILEPDG
ncbi:MAG TPA: hypothetical protein QGH10_24425, partial [Armatimonadota bacterium]|nr:hypothetical protein [Armatimonadota bacterium]